MSRPTLPRIVERLLSRLLPPEWVESIEGDIEEERTRRRATGAKAGALWATLLAVNVALALARERRTPRSTGTGGSMLKGLSSDVRFAVRALRRQPGYATAAIVTLALGIGANTAVFGLANWLLLRPIPGVSQPTELVTATLGVNGGTFGVSVPVLASLKEHVSGLSDLTAFQAFDMNVATPNGEARRVATEIVDGRFFGVLGGVVARGRDFTAAEGSDPGVDPAAVISDHFWRDVLGGDAGAIGRPLLVNGERCTIVGVTVRGFHGASRTSATDLWVPVGQHRRLLPQYSATLLSNSKVGFYFALLGRMRPGATVQVVGDQFEAVRSGLEKAASADPRLRRMRFSVRPGLDPIVWAREQLTSSFSLLTGVTALLLVLTCANVTNLVLGRVTGRRTEIATRLALGAPRRRVIRLLVVETGLLAGAASLVALAVAWLAGRAFEGTVVLHGLPPLDRAEVDWRVMAMALSASVAAAVAAGVAPALASSRPDLQDELRSHGRTLTARGGRLRQLLAVMQVAVSLTLVGAALLLARSMAARHAIDPGFDARRVLTFSIEPRMAGYDDARRKAAYRDILGRIRSLHGVQSAGLSWSAPYAPIANDAIYWAQDRPDVKIDAEMNYVTDGFFAALGARIVAGREFSPAEMTTSSDGGPVIINESAARKLFGGSSAVGRRIVFSYPKDAVRVIAGVVSDLRQRQFMLPPEPMLFEPFSGNSTWASVIVGLAAPAPAIIAGAQQAVSAVDARLPIYNVTTVQEAINRQLADHILITRLTTTLAMLATVIAAIGLYGVLARAVADRRRELSVRAALGAGPAALARLVGIDGVRVMLIGIAVGLAMAAWLTRYLRAYLYGVDRLDPLSLLGAIALLVAAALLAMLPPARRAARVDPAAELK